MPTSFTANRIAVSFALAFALILFPTRSRSAETTDGLDLTAIGAPSFESFTPRDGLPEGVVTTVGVDVDGFAWAATAQGLYRFIGHRWQQQTTRDRGSVYRRIGGDSTGAFWAASVDKDILRLRGGRWESVPRVAAGLSNHAYRVTETRDARGHSHIWLLSTDHGIFELANNVWRPDPGNASLPLGQLSSLAVTTQLFSETRQWIGTGDLGVWFRREGETAWQPFVMAGMVPGQIEDLQRTVDAKGESLWISAFRQGLYRVRSDGARKWSVESGELRSNEVYSITTFIDPVRGAGAWVASRSGLVRVRGDLAETFDRRHGLPSDQIRDARLWRSPSGEEVLWIATESGVARAVFTANRWQTASLMGAGAVGVFGVLVEKGPDGRDRVWVAASRGGIGLYEGGVWKSFTMKSSSLPSDGLRMIKRATDLQGKNALWAGFDGGALQRIDEGPRFSTVITPWPIEPGQAVLDVLARTQGGRRELWFATRRSGTWRLRDDGWTAFSPPGIEEGWRVYGFVEQTDSAGRSWLWAGTTRGLARFDGRQWTLLENVPGLPNTVYGVSFPLVRQSRQILWMGSELDGVIRLDVTDPLHPLLLPARDLPPSIDVTVYGATHDAAGRVYLSTNNGVQQLTPSGSKWSGRTFRRQEGMVHEECNLNAQFVDDHNRFWTGTLGGVTVFDPGSVTRGRPKTLRLIEVLVDGASVSAPGFQLSRETRELKVEYTLQSWQREAETLYRTQLIGFDPAPGPWTSQPMRVITTLPPGRYNLRVEARDYAGVAAKPLEIPFTMRPAWWQRRLVQAAFGLLALLLFLAAAQGRTRSLRLQKQRLEQEVMTRTGQLNAANGRLLLLSYTDALTGLANRRLLLETLHEIVATGNRSQCSLAIIDVDHFKLYNDRLGHPAGDEALKTIAEGLRACTPPSALVARYGGEEFACLLPGMGLDEAVRVIERMRIDMEARPIPVPGSGAIEHATISAGVATGWLEQESDIHELLRRTDVALYRAKSEGRNCVRT